jgi:hexosaminidase
MSDIITRSNFLKKVTTGGLGMGLLLRYPFLQKKNYTANDGAAKEDFKVKGFHIDLRVEVMTITALRDLAQHLSDSGINLLIIEYEASFPYQGNATISNQYAYSREDIKDFVSYCANLGIEVVPLQECLGHVQYILRHERYAGLKIEKSILSQIDPLNDDSIVLFKELIEDMASLHPSKYIHAGGDEVRHLDHPKFAGYVKEHGISGLYTKYIKKICQVVTDLGKTPLLWADMILKYPQAVEDLPINQIIFVDWNYGWDIDRFGPVQALQKKGCVFWGAPALRSSPDNYYVTGWQNHFNNIRDFIPYARQAGYEGILMTSWSTSGLYTYELEGSQEAVLEMFPIRNVYPLSGFSILMTAYTHALKIKESFNPEQFVTKYAQERFAISADDAQQFWQVLSHEQVLISTDDMKNKQKVASILEDFKEINQQLHKIQANQNKDEFAHFKLMGDIRQFYLSVKNVDVMVESNDFDRSQMASVSVKLPPLMKVSHELNQSFTAISKGYLHDAEIERLNNLRNSRLHNLWSIYGKGA